MIDFSSPDYDKVIIDWRAGSSKGSDLRPAIVIVIHPDGEADDAPVGRQVDDELLIGRAQEPDHSGNHDLHVPHRDRPHRQPALDSPYAAEHGLRLVSRDARAAGTYRAMGADLELLP
jgi:hypothetical protein